MNKQRLQQIIREEIANGIANGQQFSHYPESGAEFPMLDKDYFQRPEEIDTEKNYLQFQSSSNNQDLDKDKFPYEELKRGVEFEKVRNPEMNHFDIADIVLANIKNDVKFYSKLFGQDPINKEVKDAVDNQDKRGQNKTAPVNKTIRP